MHLLPLLAIAGFASAIPATAPHDIGSTINHNQTFTKEEVHRNVLKNLPSHHIVHSDGLIQYLRENAGSNHTIYVPDEQKWVSMSSFHVKDSSNLTSSNLAERETAPPVCTSWRQSWAAQTQTFWGAWTPASNCLWTGFDPAGASYTIDWSNSVSISENAGLSWGAIASILSASIGITVTQTSSNGGAQTCFIPGNSVGQMWAQKKLAWGWFWTQNCQSCNGQKTCDAGWADGGATAPFASNQHGQGFNLGCSTGRDKVDC